jgi:hypothetical protein
MQAIVTYAALAMGGLCFLLFLWLSIKAQTAKPSEPARQMAEKARGLKPVSVGELIDLVKALTTLSESLSKAGPALTVLIASILFLSIAAVASGAIVGKLAPPACTAPCKPADQPKT